MRLGEIGLRLQGALKASDGFVSGEAPARDAAEEEVAVRVVRGEIRRPLEGLFCFVQLTAAEEHEPKRDVRGGRGRILGDGAAVALLRAGGVALGEQAVTLAPRLVRS